MDESSGDHRYRVNPDIDDPLPYSSAPDMVSPYDDSVTAGEPLYSPLPSHPPPLRPPLPPYPRLAPPPTLPPPLLPDTSYSSCGQPPPLTGVTQHVTLPYSPMVYAPVMMGPSPHQQLESSNTNVFWLMFVKGNISRCTGCGQRTLRGEDGRPRPPPYNLCLQHKEYVMFENPHTGRHQLSSEHRNVCVLLIYSRTSIHTLM